MSKAKKRNATEFLKAKGPAASGPLHHSWPIALLAIGLLLIVASFLPVGEWSAKSQWTREDSAKIDQLSNEYKRSSFQTPARKGLSEAEAEAQREKMKQRLETLQQQLDRAKGQPQRWSRTLLWTGVLLAAAGYFAHSSRQR